jgi:probable F420-dependent oxidoreductase
MVRVGLNLQRVGLSYESILSIAQLSDSLGFDSMWIFDHIMAHGRNVTRDDILECLVTLSALAPETKRLRLGTLVLCNLFRHPALVAKMTASLDVISHGRLEVGIGIGGPSTPPELSAYGLSFPKRCERLKRLEEAIIILDAMWTRDEATFNGEYYSVKGAINNPKPSQKPHPPLWVGGEAEDIIRIAAKYADGWNCRSLDYSVLKEKIEKLDNECLRFGRNPKAVQRSWSGSIFLAKNQELKNRLSNDSWKNGYPARGPGSSAIVGTPEECVDRLQRYADLGVNLLILNFAELNADTLTLFAEKVVKNLA